MQLFAWLGKLRFFQFERADDRRFFWEWCWLAVGTLSGIAVCLALNLFNPLGNILFDGAQRLRTQQPNDNIIIVAVDDRSLAELGSWPLSRSVYAQFLKNLADTGNAPKAFGFDILMIDPSPADAELAKQMARHNVILPAELRYNESERRQMIQPPPFFLANAANTLSHINVRFDEDGFIRGSRLVESGVPHFSLAMSGKATPADDGHGNYARFSLIRPEIGFPTVSLSDAVQKNYPLSIFKDKYVVFGSTAPSLGDHYPSIYAGKQMAGTPGVVFQASLLNDLLQDGLITVANPYFSYGVYALALVIILLGILVLAPSTEMALTLSVVVIILASSILLLLKFDYWLDPMPLVVAVLVIKPIWAWRRMKMIIQFMQDRAQEMQSIEVTPAEVRRGQLIAQDAVLQYSNVLDKAIHIVKHRLDNFEKIIDDLPEAMFVLNADGGLLQANKKFKSLFTDPVFNEKDSIDTLLGYLGYTYRHIEDLLELPLGQKYLNIKGADGSFREYMVRRVELQFTVGTPLSLILFVEVTALLQFQMQRDRTLQLLSHDMRTPVASIMTLCRKALAVDGLPEEASQSVRQVTSHSKRLLSMMDDFILSIRADELVYTLSTVLFDSLLDQAIYEVRDLAEERNMTIKIEETDIIAFVQVQTRLIERVLINLLVNAIRYGQEGAEILVRTSECSNDEGVTMVRCDFMNIIGASNKSTQIQAEHKGFGLGLHFIDQVITRHNGKITRHLPDQAGHYAMITIELPTSPA
jgi:CHASE2 domain-containing sensor protein